MEAAIHQIIQMLDLASIIAGACIVLHYAEANR